MAKLSKRQIKNRKELLDDETKPIKVREKAFKEIMDERMNPESNFDPETFDPMKGVQNYDIVKRPREDPPKRLPNKLGLKPKRILEGQMIGMYESKQELYLLICALSERVADLEEWRDSI